MSAYIKYNQLVVNLVISHNVEAMTRTIKQIKTGGFFVALQRWPWAIRSGGRPRPKEI